MAVLKAPVEGAQSVGIRVVGFCEYQREGKGSGFLEKGREAPGQEQKIHKEDNGGAGV